MKRRAGSAPAEDTLDTAVDAAPAVDAAVDDASDVEMLALPPAANSEDISVVGGDIIQGLDDTSQNDQMHDVFANDDNLSTIAQGDERNEDQLDLLGLTMDQDSVYETLPDFEDDDDAPAADNPGGTGDRAPEVVSNQEMTQGKDQANESSTPNTDEAADSDAKTADTTGTSTSVEEPVKNSKC